MKIRALQRAPKSWGSHYLLAHRLQGPGAAVKALNNGQVLATGSRRGTEAAPSRERHALTCGESAGQHAQLIENAADAAQAHPPARPHQLRARETQAGGTGAAVQSRAGRGAPRGTAT